MTRRKANAAIHKAYREFEQLLATHPSREQWLPHLDALTAKAEEAFQAKDIAAFDVALDNLGIYIAQIKYEASQTK